MTVSHDTAGTPPPPGSAKGMGRWWLKWALLASLALNVLVVGAVLGAMWRGGSQETQRGNGRNILGYVMSLPATRRDELLRRGSGLRAQLRTLRQEAREANRERIAILSAPTFDRERYVAAQTRQIEAEAKVRLLFRDLVADAAGGMTVDERKAFLRWRPPFRANASDFDLDTPKRP